MIMQDIYFNSPYVATFGNFCFNGSLNVFVMYAAYDEVRIPYYLTVSVS